MSPFPEQSDLADRLKALSTVSHANVAVFAGALIEQV